MLYVIGADFWRLHWMQLYPEKQLTVALQPEELALANFTCLALSVNQYWIKYFIIFPISV